MQTQECAERPDIQGRASRATVHRRFPLGNGDGGDGTRRSGAGRHCGPRAQFADAAGRGRRIPVQRAPSRRCRRHRPTDRHQPDPGPCARIPAVFGGTVAEPGGAHGGLLVHRRLPGHPAPRPTAPAAQPGAVRPPYDAGNSLDRVDAHVGHEQRHHRVRLGPLAERRPSVFRRLMSPSPTAKGATP